MRYNMIVVLATTPTIGIPRQLPIALETYN